MKAIVQHTYGSTDVLVVADIPTPDIADDEVLVRVHAAGVDRPGARCPRAARSGLQQRRHRAGVVSATQDGSQLRVVSLAKLDVDDRVEALLLAREAGLGQ